MASPEPYTTGTVTLTHGSADIIGSGTTWWLSGVRGGVMTVEAIGNPLTLASVDSDTEAKAATRWMGASGTYNYAIALASADAADTVWASRHWSRVVGQALLSAIPFRASGTAAERDALNPPLANGEWFGLAEPGAPEIIAQLKVPGGWRNFSTRGAAGAPAPLTNLGGLSDVTISAPAAGKVLRHDGNRWHDSVLQIGDVGGVASGHLIGRTTAGAGAAEPLTAEQARTLLGLPADPASTLMAAMAVAPDARRSELISATIMRLRAAGVWTRLEMLYVLAAHDEQAARLNWRSPGTYTLTAVNSPAFAIDRGFTGDDNAAYLAVGRAPNQLTLYQQDSAHAGAYVLNEIQGDEYPIGTLGGDSGPRLRPRSAGGSMVGRINSNVGGSGDMSVAATTSIGHSLMVRTGPTAAQIYRDGQQLVSSAAPSDIRSVSGLVILRQTANGSPHEVAAAHWGASLTAAQAAAMSTIMREYLIELGAVS